MPRSFAAGLVGLQLKSPSQVPLYQQLFAQLRGSILNGDLPAGTRLPATRTAAAELGCSRSTVLVAFEMLAAEGYIESRTGSGTYVTKTVPDEAISRNVEGDGKNETGSRADPTLSAMASTLVELALPNNILPHSRVIFPDVREFPFETWVRLFRSLWREPEPELLGPHDALGYLPLRRAISGYLRSVRGLVCEPEQVAITSGSSHALQMLFSLLLSPGDGIWLEDPSPPWVKAKALACGALPTFVPVDNEGIMVGEAERKAPDARVALVTPSHQFPLGYVLSPRRRTALLDWADAAGAWIIEDDFDSEFRYAGRPLPPLYSLDRRSRVFYVASFSKITLPNLRLGYIVLPPQFVSSFERVRAIMDRYTSIQLQPVLAAFIEEGHFAAHVRRMRALYEARQEALLTLSESHLGGLVQFTPKEGGMHSVGWLQERVTTRMTAAEIVAINHGNRVQVAPLSAYCEEASRPEALLLGYARYSERELKVGVAELAARIERACG